MPWWILPTIPRFKAPRNTRKKAQGGYQKHGYYRLKRAVKELGNRAIDGRTTTGKALAQWRAEILCDLGGEETVSAQCRAIVDTAVTTKLLLDSVTNWLLRQPSLINARKRCLYPVVLQRQQLADALARYMTQLGLERKAREVKDLKSYLAEHASEGGST